MIIHLIVLEDTTSTGLLSIQMDTDIQEQPEWATHEDVKSLIEQSSDLPFDTILTPINQEPSYAQISRIGTTSMFHYSPKLKPLIYSGNTLDLEISEARTSKDSSSIILEVKNPDSLEG